LPGKRLVHADEILGRRDVVVDQRHPIRERKCSPRSFGTQRKVVEQQLVRSAEVHQLAVVSSLRLEAIVCSLDEDLRVVSMGPQHPLNAEHLVADRIAVAKCGENLMDWDHR
jgi:hypothetical protein